MKWLAASLIALTFCCGAAKTYAVELRDNGVAALDGDTLELVFGRPTRIRLAAIDAPEKGQPYGARARQFTGAQAFGKPVLVRTAGADPYGRILADIVLPNRRILNHELVAAGYAWHYTRYSRDSVLQDLEQQARSSRRGLWADAKPVPPWEYPEARRQGQSIGRGRKEICI